MTITAAEVKELRDRTGVSMMECKKALTEANGDIEKAIDELRKSGIAKAAKKSDRDASEGTIQAVISGDKGAIVQLFCETDFVARNEEFPEIAKKIAAIAVEKGADGAVADADQIIKDAVLKLGENIKLGEIKVIEGSELDAYIHSNAKFGAIIATEGVDEATRHGIAMHISISAPECISPDEVSAELIAKEKEIWAAQLANEGKPAEIIEKIMLGKESKFRAEKALLTQPYVQNPDQTIQQLIGKGKIVTFYRLAI